MGGTASPVKVPASEREPQGQPQSLLWLLLFFDFVLTHGSPRPFWEPLRGAPGGPPAQVPAARSLPARREAQGTYPVARWRSERGAAAVWWHGLARAGAAGAPRATRPGGARHPPGAAGGEAPRAQLADAGSAEHSAAPAAAPGLSSSRPPPPSSRPSGLSPPGCDLDQRRAADGDGTPPERGDASGCRAEAPPPQPHSESGKGERPRVVACQRPECRRRPSRGKGSGHWVETKLGLLSRFYTPTDLEILFFKMPTPEIWARFCPEDSGF